MRALIVTEFVSIDGVMEAPGGEEGYKHRLGLRGRPHRRFDEVQTEELFESEAGSCSRLGLDLSAFANS